MPAARAAIGRWGVRASATAARALVGVDRLRAAAARRDPRVHDLGEPPAAVLAVVAHWRPDTPEARLAHLEECVAGLLALDAPEVTAVVLTNAPQPTADDLAARFEGRPVRVAPAAAITEGGAGEREIVVVGWRPGLRHRHGFYLTWGHVPLLRAAARTGRFSHLVYLEDDMRFTGEHLSYWRRYRAPLAEHGLLPGFARFEWRDGERFLVDALRPLDAAPRRRVVDVDGRPTAFVNLENPYQALYVLDRALYESHFRFSRGRSPLRSRASEWEIRERAASGPIFDDVPAGLVSRNVVPVLVEDDRHRLDPSCLVEHMASTHSTSGGPFGVLKVDELFTVGSP